MKFVETPPSDWDERIAFPLQSVGFAHAARALGHHPLFAEDQQGLALVLVRRVPVPVLRAWTPSRLRLTVPGACSRSPGCHR